MIGRQPNLLMVERTISRVSLGMAGEQWLANRLEARGYRVAITHRVHQGDLMVYDADGVIVAVEVKTARKGKDGKYRFTLRKKDKHCDHRGTDFVALLCVMKTGEVIPFIVPTGAIWNQQQAVVCSHPRKYAGKLAKYRQDVKGLRLE